MPPPPSTSSSFSAGSGSSGGPRVARRAAVPRILPRRDGGRTRRLASDGLDGARGGAHRRARRSRPPGKGAAMTDTSLDTLCVDTIRTLAMDAVQQANSGHPGTPMAMAPVAYALWQRQMRFDPEDPIWPNRDRFVLSMGHASMLLYSLLHLTGVQAVNPEYERLGAPAVTLDDIRHFRQLDSKCPGHPEYHWTSGVETTTGPLGQGVATSVGMAIAGRWLAARYNRPTTRSSTTTSTRSAATAA